MTTRAVAEEVLRRLTASDSARFRTGQWEAIEELVERRGRVLVVQRTGWGKSAVYFVATRLLRDRGAGPTLLVSPLLALMRNQVQMASRAGVRAETINSANREDWGDIEAQVRQGDVDILLISPERLNNPRFRREVLPQLVRTVGLLVVDEAHCISDWGHDFRPDYRRLARVLQLLPASVPVLCTTATANDRVVADVVEQLGDDLEVIRGPLDRLSLALSVVELADPARRLAWLARAIPQLPGSGIVYCLTVADTHRVADWLKSQRISAVAYSGESEHEDRLVFEEIPDGQPGQGGGRHVGPGDGLRQAGSHLRRALPESRLPGRVLPAGGARRAGRRARPRHPAAGARGCRHPGLLHPHRLPHEGEGWTGGPALGTAS